MMCVIPRGLWLSLFSVLPTLPVTDEIQSGSLALLSRLMQVAVKSGVDLRVHLPLLAHNVTNLLETMTHSKEIKNVVMSGEGLLACFILLEDPDSLVQFLPGTVSKMTHICQNKSHHAVLNSAMDILEFLISQVLADAVSAPFLPSIHPKEVLPIPKTKFLVRSQPWFDSTVKQIQLVLTNVLYSLKAHDHPKVRSRVLKLATSLILTCGASLQSSLEILVEVVCFYTVDETESISAFALESLEKVQSSSIGPLVNDAVQKRLFYSLDHLSTTHLSQKGIEHIRMARALLGYSSVASSLVLESNLDGFIDSLISISQLKYDDTFRIMSQSSSSLVSGQEWMRFPRKHFAHLHDSDMIAQLELLLESLGSQSPVLLNSLLSRIQNEKSDLGPLLFIANHVLKGLQGQERAEWASTLIREYQSLEITQNPSNLTDSQLLKGAYTASDFHKVAVANSLILEGMATAASGMTPKGVGLVMMDSLYFLLEKVSDRNEWVRVSAECALGSFTHSFFKEGGRIQHALMSQNVDLDPSISSLVKCHVDYLIESISRRIPDVLNHPKLPGVLIAAIKMGGRDIVGPIMSDSVELVFDVLDDLGTSGLALEGQSVEFSTHLIDQFLAVLMALLEVLPPRQRDLKPIQPSISKISKEMEAFKIKHEKVPELEPDETFENAKEYFLDRMKQVDETPSEPQEEPVNILTQYESLSIGIVRKALHFLRNDDPWIRARVLRMLDLGLEQLANQSKELLPLIADIWPVAIARCKDSEHFVILEALNLIQTMAELSHDFVRQRVSSDLVPKMQVMFKKLHQSISGQESIHGRTYSKQVAVGVSMNLTESKIIVNSFKTVLMITSNVPLTSMDSNMFVECLVPFLNDKIYTQGIRDVACEIIKSLVQRNGGDWVYVKLMATLGCHSLLPNDSILGVSPICIPKWFVNESRVLPMDGMISGVNELMQVLGMPLTIGDQIKCGRVIGSRQLA